MCVGASSTPPSSEAPTPLPIHVSRWVLLEGIQRVQLSPCRYRRRGIYIRCLHEMRRSPGIPCPPTQPPLLRAFCSGVLSSQIYAVRRKGAWERRRSASLPAPSLGIGRLAAKGHIEELATRGELSFRRNESSSRVDSSPPVSSLHGALSLLKTRECPQNCAAPQLPSGIKRRSTKVELGDRKVAVARSRLGGSLGGGKFFAGEGSCAVVAPVGVREVLPVGARAPSDECMVLDEDDDMPFYV